MTGTATVARKLLEIQKSVRALSKDAKAYNYDYVSGDKLLALVRPKMDELSLMLLPEVLDVTTETVTYRSWDKQARAAVDKTEVLYTLKMRMTWLDAETGGTLQQEWAAAGLNAFDKGFGSALTYGERYYLLKLFHLQTDKDDVDAVSRERDEAMDMARRPQKGPQKAAEELDGETYRKLVESAARGERTKSGQTIRYWFIMNTGPDEEQLRRFDSDVAQARARLGGEAGVPTKENDSKENNNIQNQ